MQRCGRVAPRSFLAALVHSDDGGTLRAFFPLDSRLALACVVFDSRGPSDDLPGPPHRLSRGFLCGSPTDLSGPPAEGLGDCSHEATSSWGRETPPIARALRGRRLPVASTLLTEEARPPVARLARTHEGSPWRAPKNHLGSPLQACLHHGALPARVTQFGAAIPCSEARAMVITAKRTSLPQPRA